MIGDSNMSLHPLYRHAPPLDTPTRNVERELVEDLTAYLEADKVKRQEIKVMVATLVLFVREKVGNFDQHTIGQDDDVVTIQFHMEASFQRPVVAQRLQAIGNGDVIGRSFVRDAYLEVVGTRCLLCVELWRKTPSAEQRKLDDWETRKTINVAHFRKLVDAGVAKSKVPVGRISERAGLHKDDAQTLIDLIRALCGSTERRCYLELYDPTKTTKSYLLKCWGLDRISYKVVDAIDAVKREVLDRFTVCVFRDQRDEYGAMATSYSLQVQIEVRSFLSPRTGGSEAPVSVGKKRSRGFLDALASALANGSDQKKRK